MRDEYVYYCPKRAPVLGNVPLNGLMYVETFRECKYMPDIDGFAWGWAVYNRELGPREIHDYDLIIKPREGR